MDQHNAYDIEGFERRPTSPSPPHDPDIIEISDDDDSDVLNHPGMVSSNLENLSITQLRVKKEQIDMELQHLEDDAFTGDSPLNVNSDTFAAESAIQNVQNQQMKVRSMSVTPESTRFSVSSGFESINQHYDRISDDDIEDDYVLDLPGNRKNVYQQKENKENTPKVQFTVSSVSSARKKLKPMSSAIQDDPIDDESQTLNFNFSNPVSHKRESFYSTFNTKLETSFTGQFTNDVDHDMNLTENPTTNPLLCMSPGLMTPKQQVNLFDTSNYDNLNENFSDTANDITYEGTPYRSPMSNANYSGINQIDSDLYRQLESSLIKSVELKYELQFQKKFDSLEKELAKYKNRHESNHRSSTKRKQSSHSNHDNKRKMSPLGHISTSKIKMKSPKTCTATSASQQDISDTYLNANNVKIMKTDSHSEESSSSISLIRVSDVPASRPSEVASGSQFKSRGNNATTARPTHLESNRSSKRHIETLSSGSKRKSLNEPKNNDKSLYLSSVKAKICVLCSKHYSRTICSHYKTKHSDREVFVSRLSPKVTKIAIKKGFSFVKYLKGSSNSLHLKTFCVFCEKERDFMPHYWNDHLRSHTGEYMNECLLCLSPVSFYYHCNGIPTRKISDFNLFRCVLYGYSCKKCNFVQIDEENMIKHLENEHSPTQNIQKYYQRFTLLPALNSLPFQDILNDSTAMRPTSTMVSTQKMLEPNLRPVTVSQTNCGIRVLENLVVRPANNDSTEVNAHTVEQPSISEMYDQEANGTNGGEQLVNAENPLANMYKMDIEEETNLMGVFKEHETTGKYELSIRPWLEADWARKPLVNLLTQFALYKCMHGKCIYATNSEEAWIVHMRKHIDLIDVMAKLKILTSHKRDEYIKFRDCPYCTKESHANFEVNTHMELEHRRSGFQCAHCFYRCIEMDYMVFHYQNFHPDKSREVLLCSEKKEFEYKDKELIFEYLKEMKKIVCGQDGCNEEFSCFNSHFAHLTVCHSSDQYICPQCLRSMECNELIIQNHFKCHKIEEFQCIYCKSCFSEVGEIREHMSLAHASHFSFVAARRSSKPESDEDDPQIVYIGNSMRYTEFALINCRDFDALNYMDPHILKIETQLAMIENQPRNMKLPFVGELPTITFNGTKKDFYVTYDDYLKLCRRCYQDNEPEIERPVTRSIQEAPNTERSEPNEPIEKRENIDSTMDQVIEIVKTKSVLNITYHCITSDAIKMFNQTENFVYKSQLCTDCSDFIKINDDTEQWKYLDHLMQCIAPGPSKCTQSTINAFIMVKHRLHMHSKMPIQFMQVEKSERLFVYKLVQCKFQCNIESCNQQFDTHAAMIKHSSTYHPTYYLDTKIVQHIKVLASNDPEQPIKSEENETGRFEFYHLFWCNSHKKTIGKKWEAINHYNQSHLGHDNFEVSIKSFVNENTTESESSENDNNDKHRMYVFECLHCLKLFATHDEIKAHIQALRLTNMAASYTIKKLVACSECKEKSISTLAGLQVHCAHTHPGKSCAAVNIVNSNMCGICGSNYLYKNELCTHFAKNHQAGDIMRRVLYKSLGLHLEENLTFLFAPGCCLLAPGMRKFDAISCVVQHIAECSRRFKCTDCPNVTFHSSTGFIQHCKGHNQSSKVIAESIHNIKEFFALLSDMHIFLSNGLMVTKKQIEDNPIGEQFSKEISKSVEQIFARENFYIDL